MNGAHDLGGKHGLGPINPEPETEEPVFHAEWERRVFALTLATGMLGCWNIDESRYARERQHPLDYLNNSYYENWLAGLQHLLEEKRLTENQASAALRIPDEAAARKILAGGSPTALPAESAAKFSRGDRVRVRKIQHRGHTRAPAYAQGAIGEIADCYGCHIYADDHARGIRRGEPLYCVAFAGVELFGPDAQAHEVRIDLWEPYLEHLTP